jgi:hypothetical protein
MESFYLLDYLKKNSYLDEKRYDNLRYELDNHLHYYGNHFKYPHEISGKKNRHLFRIYAKYFYTLFKIFQNRRSSEAGELILSNAYFTVNEQLKRLGYKVYCPSWRLSADRNILSNLDIFHRGEKIKSKFRDSDFKELLKGDFMQEISEFEERLILFFKKNKIKALFIPNDVSFFENLSIEVCKQINIPSFIFLHGLPGRYNQIDENRTNYLIVWGEKIKENYIKAGINPNKIFVSGHPYYKKLDVAALKFKFDNVLVLTKSIVGAHHSDGVILGDRGNLILYLFSLEKILKSLGIQSVRFRPHPAENENWYLKFINNDFYKIDKGNLKQSLQNSTLIIGPTSTVFLESLYYGVNYTVYEPSLNNKDLTNCELVPPFDGSDSKVPVAKNEEQLSYILKNKIAADPSCFNDYISTPFDFSFIKRLI